ncbi:50S ribosomal protein L3 [Candidatus Parcubacteria bacterium]|nr:50S ribosomal protein L3 [Candidatus Parcubacteria bacterium]
MKFTLGIKQNMTQLFDEEGRVHPVTILQTGPMTITGLRTSEKDGYKAVQVGFGTRHEKNINNAQKGQFGALGNFRYVQEFRLAEKDNAQYTIGDKIDLAGFKEGDTIQVSAISKGKGFQGVVKRHGFHGGPRSHGQKHSEREPGSISGGLRTTLRSGMRMAGRMGSDRTTVKNLKVAQINPEAGLIVVRGAIPGRRGTLVEIRG